MAAPQLSLPLLDFGGEETPLEPSDDIEAPDSPPPAEDIAQGQASDDEEEDEAEAGAERGARDFVVTGAGGTSTR